MAIGLNLRPIHLKGKFSSNYARKMELHQVVNTVLILLSGKSSITSINLVVKKLKTFACFMYLSKKKKRQMILVFKIPHRTFTFCVYCLFQLFIKIGFSNETSPLVANVASSANIILFKNSMSFKQSSIIFKIVEEFCLVEF